MKTAAASETGSCKERKKISHQHIYRTHKESISVIVKNKDTEIKTNLA